MSRKMPIAFFVCMLTIVTTAGVARAQLAYLIVQDSLGNNVGTLSGPGSWVFGATGMVPSGQTILPLPPTAVADYTTPTPPLPTKQLPVASAGFLINSVVAVQARFYPNPPTDTNPLDAPTVSFAISPSPPLYPPQFTKTVSAAQDAKTGLWKANLGLAPGDYYLATTLHNGSGTTQAYVQLQVVNLPAAPTGVTATTAVGGITASWPAVGGAAGYSLKIATSAGGPFTVAQFPVNGTTATLTNLTPNTTYYLVVSALNGAGESPNSTNPVPVLTPPAIPTNVVALPPAPNYLALMWTPSPGAASYSLNLGGATVTATAAAANCPTGVGMCTYGASGFPSETQTSCSVAAINASGGQSAYSGAIYCATQ